MKLSNTFSIIVLLCIAASPVNAKNDKDKGQPLPPGLQKKAMKGKPLPPGWQKKLAKGQVMDREVYRQSQVVVPVDNKGLLTVRIEGKLVRLFAATREIVEVLEH